MPQIPERVRTVAAARAPVPRQPQSRFLSGSLARKFSFSSKIATGRARSHATATQNVEQNSSDLKDGNSKCRSANLEMATLKFRLSDWAASSHK
jgi:hypothetical protein